MPPFPASLIVRHSKACSNEGTSQKSGTTQQFQKHSEDKKNVNQDTFFSMQVLTLVAKGIACLTVNVIFVHDVLF